MRAELISAAELSESDLRRWRELSGRAVEPNPFFEPGYALALARGVSGIDELRLLVVRGTEGWLGCLLVHVVPRWHRVPVRALSTWRGHDFFGLLGTPLIAPEAPTETAAVLLEGMDRLVPQARFGALEWLSEDGEAARAVGEALAERRPRPLVFESFERATVRRRPEPTYLDGMSGKRRKEMRRLWRKLGEEMGEEPEVVDRAGEEGACADLVALEAGGRKGERGAPMAGQRGQVAFFTEMCRTFATQGRLQMLTLRAAGTTLAVQCNLRAGNTLFGLKIAFDEDYARFSPGVLLEARAIERFHEDPGLDLMDSCAASNNAMINRLWPDRRTLSTLALPRPGARGRLVRPVLAAARGVRDRKIARAQAR